MPLEGRAVVISSFRSGHTRKENATPYTRPSNNKNADLEAEVPK